MFRKAIAVAGVALGLFHAWLLAGQAWNGELIEPGLLFRWLTAAGLLAALVALRRQGSSIVFGKRPVAIWLLAVLLHGPAVASRIDLLGAPAMPEVVATLAQVTLASATIVALGLLFALGVLRVRRHSLASLSLVVADRAPIRASAPITRLLFAPRPPPGL